MNRIIIIVTYAITFTACCRFQGSTRNSRHHLNKKNLNNLAVWLEKCGLLFNSLNQSELSSFIYHIQNVRQRLPFSTVLECLIREQKTKKSIFSGVSHLNTSAFCNRSTKSDIFTVIKTDLI